MIHIQWFKKYNILEKHIFFFFTRFKFIFIIFKIIFRIFFLGGGFSDVPALFFDSSF